MSRGTRFFLMAVLVAVCLPPRVGRTEGVRQVPIGPRAIALGGAYTALSDDASGIFWNPAGLAGFRHQEFAGTRANRFDTGLRDSYLAFVLPISSRIVLATDWYHAGFDDAELDFGENRFDLSCGYRISDRIATGASLKLLTRNTAVDGESLADGRGVGADLGLLVRPARGVRLGVVARDVFDTRLDYSGGGNEVVYRRELRFGAAYRPLPALLLTGDLGDRYRLGMEISPLEVLALRAGLNRDPSEDLDATMTFGAGIKAGLFRFDYAYEAHPVLEATSHFGLALEFNFNPSRVRIERIETRPMFASLFKRYAWEPVAVAYLRNLEGEPITVRLQVQIPGLMDGPSEQEVVLSPRAVQPVPLTALLDDRALAVLDNRHLNIEVAAVYTSARLVRRERASEAAVLYRKGAVHWGGGVDQAAAFITVEDPVIRDLARSAIRGGPAEGLEFFPTPQLRNMSAIVSALAALGITYVPDPNNPYAEIGRLERAVDTVHYPRETLARRTGDCDDTTVLLAALLETVGIATRIVDVPGHLLLLADSGLLPHQAEALGMERRSIQALDGSAWIPLETTALRHGFLDVWDEGTRTMEGWRNLDPVRFVDVGAARARYEAGIPAGDGPEIGFDPDATDAGQRATAGRFANWVDARLHDLTGRAEGMPVTADALDRAAATEFLAGRPEAARAHLLEARSVQGSARVLANLGAVEYVLGMTDSAEANFQAALALDPEDGGVWLNLGLLRHLTGDAEGGDLAIGEGVRRTEGFRAASALLNLPVQDSSAREGTLRVTVEVARRLIQRAVRQGMGPGVAEASERTDAEAGEAGAISGAEDVESGLQLREDSMDGDPGGVDVRRPAPSIDTLLAMGRADEAKELPYVLYWKLN